MRTGISITLGEAASFVAQFEDERLPDGRHRVVRHGTGPERMIQTGIGPIPVQRRKVRDRAAGVPDERKIRFTSNILPRRWVVERTFAWLGRCRRLAKDWETSLETSTAWTFIASIKIMTRRLATYCHVQ